MPSETECPLSVCLRVPSFPARDRIFERSPAPQNRTHAHSPCPRHHPSRPPCPRSANVSPTCAPLCCLAWAPDGREIAAADAAGALCLVAIRGYDGAPVGVRVLRAPTERAPAPLVALDWSADCSLVRANCAARALEHWRADDAERAPPDAARGAVWATHSCPLAPAALGAPPDAPRATCSTAADGGGLLLLGDEAGGLALATADADALGLATEAGRTGTPSARAERRAAAGAPHGGPVAAVCAVSDGQAASVGAADGAVMLWGLGERRQA